MSINASFIGELKHESENTRKLLERVPFNNPLWLPHEKSMSLGRLATHIAELPVWITRILNADEFDFATHTFKSYAAANQEELMQIFNDNLNAAIESLQKATDEDFSKTWTMRRGNSIVTQIPKKVAIRSLTLSHIIHHRGQLSVYLRLLNVPVPGLYGPSADEK
jgi:uncharacterized damage-inducible protein DinB